MLCLELGALELAFSISSLIATKVNHYEPRATEKFEKILQKYSSRLQSWKQFELRPHNHLSAQWTRSVNN